ncbi:type I glyceraldehyde-3-phosphate dehydrogenase [Umboniibacter marinipuniceus]|uniref:Erythrose 4-phosphate dehydrogenase n=1 Tax=Umboniibacter marinipuniceus TaxID=569599 RepID=A0A3M0AEX4_9GAMM|nr:glyceraldehyde 3-phosphate dehydrogenase NAD-binding domain-containing protein [Umboniibacter marinipuniceus]RMA82239.1 erythrose 4-phosphate dehydrogenase [Umboniibacter marinipuniceus]
MSAQLAINGFGRIGRSVLRAIVERDLWHHLAVVSINELAPIETICHLLKYDSTHGRFPGSVVIEDNCLVVNGHVINITHEADFTALQIDVDVLIECSGSVSAEEARRQVGGSLKHVLISNPSQPDVDRTLIYGFNQDQVTRQDGVISCGSCTSNALIPMVAVLDEQFGVVAGSSLTLHSAMNDQPVIDAYHDVDLRLTRSAMQSMIPVETALDRGVYRLLPHLEGRLHSSSIRVPTSNVSAIELTVQTDRAITRGAFTACLQQLADSNQYISISTEPLASCDFIHDHHSAVIDVPQSAVVNHHLVKVLIWFDNEWGYANRLVDSALHVQQMISLGELT